MRRLIVVAQGIPGAQGSKRHMGGGHLIESSKRVAPWREAVKWAAIACIRDQQWEPTIEPLAVTVTFTLARPRSHYRASGRMPVLKEGAPTAPTTRPDLDKLLRSTLDALTDAGALLDDSHVTALTAVKCYPGGDLDALDVPGACIHITAQEPP